MQGLHNPLHPAPNQGSRAKIVHIGGVALPLLSLNLVNAKMGNAAEVTVFHSIPDHVLDYSGNCSLAQLNSLATQCQGSPSAYFARNQL